MSHIVNIAEVNAIFKETERKLSDLVGRKISIQIEKQKSDSILYYTILVAVCQAADVAPEKVLSQTREQNAVNARFITMHLINKVLGDDAADMAWFFKRDRTSVTHALGAIKERIDTGDAIATELLNAVEKRITTSYNSIKTTNNA